MDWATRGLGPNWNKLFSSGNWLRDVKYSYSCRVKTTHMMYRRRLYLDLETWFKMNFGIRGEKMKSGNGFKVIVSNHMTLMK